MAAMRGDALNTRREITSALAAFLVRVYNSHARYLFVSITERRFSNFFYTIFSDRLGDFNVRENDIAEKLVSNNGLLLKHQVLADHYRAWKTFPPLLIVDDLIIHGRSLGKFLLQLEQAVIADMERMTGPLSEEERDALHEKLVDAVDIWVFARSRNPMLLEDGYAAKVAYDYKLYDNQLHQVTNLLSKVVNSTSIANTSFVLSARHGSSHAGDGKSNVARTALADLPEMKTDRASWRHVSWISRWNHTGKKNCTSKKLHVYIRACADNQGETYLISTVRFYESESPLLTSYPIFSRLEMNPVMGEGFGSTYKELAALFSSANPCYSVFCDILRDENSYAEQVRGELVSTFLSIADLMEFCDAYRLPLKETFRETDVVKLLINYGGNTRAAFHQLLESSSLCQQAAAVIRVGLRHYADRLPFEDFTRNVFLTYLPVNNKQSHLLALFGADNSVSEQVVKYTDDDLWREAITYPPQLVTSDWEDNVVLHDLTDHLRALVSDHAKPEENWDPVSKIALSEDFSKIPAQKLDPCKIVDYINNKLEQAIYRVGISSETEAYHYFDVPFLYRADNFDNYIPCAADFDSDFDKPAGMISFQEYMRLCRNLPVSDYGRVAAYLALVDKGCIAGKLQFVPFDSSVYSVCKAGERAMFYLPQKFSVFVPALAAVERDSPILNLSPREAVRHFVKDLTYSGECRAISVDLFDLKTFIDEYLNTMGKSGQQFAGWDFADLTNQAKGSLQEAAQKSFVAQATSFLQR